MKKYLFLSFALLTSYSALAQSKEVLSGDYDNDGVITVADVTYMSEIILGHKQPVYITSPQAVDLEFKGQAFVDPTGTFPQFFKYDEGQGINVIGMRGQESNSIYVNLNTVEGDGFTGHSDGGIFSLRQDETQYMAASGFSEYSVDENGQLMLTFDYGRYIQWYNGYDKHLRDDYNYVVSKPTNFADGKASFEVCNIGALVRLSLSGLPANAWVGRVTLESADGAPLSGRFIKVNVTADRPIVSVDTDRDDADLERMELETGDCWTTADGKCEVYMMMPPVDLSGKKLNVLTSINGVQFRAEVQGQNMVSNHCYTYEAKDAAMQLDRKPLTLGENKIVEEWSEQIFIPAVDGIYEITSTGSFDLYDAGLSEIGYEMKANTPYRIFVYGPSTLTITKQEFQSLELGKNKVGNATYYELTLPTAGYYYFKSGKGENYMWTNRIGNNNISSDNNNCYYLEAGSCYIRFNDDDQITIGAATPLALGEANTVEAYSYYTFSPSEEGLYRFSSDVDNHISVWGDNYWGPECNTPQSLVLTPEERALRVKVWNAGKLTIEKVEVQEIALGTDTQVKANIENKPVYTFYQFVVTEKGFYHIQAPEEYGMEITSQGRDRDQQLEPGTYYIRFYHWNWDNPEDQDITVKISKTAGEAEDIDDPYASNAVQLSTEENAVYYRFRPIESGTYHINVGNGCNFEILHRGSARFMELNDWGGDYYVRFWSESGDASMTTTTFSISMAETVEMAVGEWVEVSSDKLYRLVGTEEGAEYYFSAQDGYHMCRVEWNESYYENFSHTIWGEWTLYFYHDTNSATTAQVRVKKVDRENAVTLPFGEETTVEIGATVYSFSVPEGGEYSIIVGEGCAYDIEGYGNYSGWLDGNTTYYVTFYNQEGYSQQTTTARIVTLDEITPLLELGVETEVNTTYMKYKFEITEENLYRITLTDGWGYSVDGYGQWSECILYPGTYKIAVWYAEEWASETATVKISKLADKTIKLSTTKTTVNNSDQWYKLTIVEGGLYEISTTGGWLCEIYDHGTVYDGLVTLNAGTYYVHFYPTSDTATSTRVSIGKYETKSITLGESFVVDDPEQYYTLVLPESAFYEFNVGEGWACQFDNDYRSFSGVQRDSFVAGVYTLHFENTDDSYESASVIISLVETSTISLGENATTSGQLYVFTAPEDGFYAITGTTMWLSINYNVEEYPTSEDALYYYMSEGSSITFESIGNPIIVSRVESIPIENTVEIDYSTTFEPNKSYNIVIPETGYYRLRYDDDTHDMGLYIRNAERGYYLYDADSYDEIPAGTYYFKSWWNVTATIYKDEK